MTLQLDKRTRLSVQRASRRSTGLRVRKRKTAHRVDQKPPDAPSERPHDNVLNHSHSMRKGVDGARVRVPSSRAVYAMRWRLPRFAPFGTHLVLTRAVILFGSGGLHVC